MSRAPLLCALLLLAGCAESVTIRTRPSGARVYINDHFVGTSPVEYGAARSQVSHLHYRIEHDDYRPLEGDLSSHIAPGRIVGAVFSLGISAAFRGFYYIEEPRTLHLEPVNPTITIAPPKGSSEERLRKLQDLYDQGLIDEREFKRKPRMELVPANEDLATVDAELIGEIGWDRTLKEALAPIADRYDRIFIDCPPSLGVLTVNALVAASTCLVPLQCEFLSMRGLAQLQKITDKVHQKAKPTRAVRIIRTMYDPRTLHSRGPKIYKPSQISDWRGEGCKPVTVMVALLEWPRFDLRTLMHLGLRQIRNARRRLLREDRRG